MLEGWWSISAQALIEALRRVDAGDSPDVVYAELYANADVEFAEVDDATQDGEA